MANASSPGRRAHPSCPCCVPVPPLCWLATAQPACLWGRYFDWTESTGPVSRHGRHQLWHVTPRTRPLAPVLARGVAQNTARARLFSVRRALSLVRQGAGQRVNVACSARPLKLGAARRCRLARRCCAGTARGPPLELCCLYRMLWCAGTTTPPRCSASTCRDYVVTGGAVHTVSTRSARVQHSVCTCAARSANASFRLNQGGAPLNHCGGSPCQHAPSTCLACAHHVSSTRPTTLATPHPRQTRASA